MAGNDCIKDQVYGWAQGEEGEGGALAEYTVADGHMMAPKPRNLTVREGAALRRDRRVFPPNAPCVSLQPEGPGGGD